MDISVWDSRSGWAVGCAYAGKAAVQADTVYDASVFACRADGKSIAAKTARHCDIAASLRNNRLDCDAFCAADTVHQARAGRKQVDLLSWLG